MNPTFHETEDDKYFSCSICLERHDHLRDAFQCCKSLLEVSDPKAGRQQGKQPAAPQEPRKFGTWGFNNRGVLNHPAPPCPDMSAFGVKSRY